MLRNGEVDRRAGAAADPVALHDLDRFGPVEQVEIGQQPLGVRGDAELPLLEWPLEDGKVAAVASALRRDLFIGQHGSETRTPVDGRFLEICEALGIDDGGTRILVERRPGRAVGRRALPCVELGDQLGDRTRAVGVGVVPRVEDLQEDPLRPAVVRKIGRRDTAPRVVRQAERAELAAHVGDVGFRRDPRMLARLEGVLLGRKTERVVPERVQHVAPVHPLEAREDVRADVAERVPDVETGSTRVREHVEDVELLAPRHPFEPVGERTTRVRRPECPLLLPVLLPPRLDLVRDTRVVAVRWYAIFRGLRHGMAHRERA